MAELQHLKRSAGQSVPVLRDTVPLLDKVHIHQLSSVLGPARVASLLHLLSKELSARPVLIRRVVLEGDVSRARHESHSLRGATTSVGAMAVGKVASVIEHAPNLQAMAAALPALDRQAALTRLAISSFLPPDPSSESPS